MTALDLLASTTMQVTAAAPPSCILLLIQISAMLELIGMQLYIAANGQGSKVSSSNGLYHGAVLCIHNEGTLPRFKERMKAYSLGSRTE